MEVGGCAYLMSTKKGETGHRPTARIVVSRGTRSGRNTAYHEDRSDYSRLGLQNASGCAIGNPKNLRDLEYAKIPELATVLVSEKRESLWDICKTEPKMSDSQDRHQWQYKSLARRPMCTFCGKVLDSPSRLRDHLLQHIGTKTEKCDVCGLEFKYRRSCQSHKLKQHQPGTLPPNRFRCDLCERSYRFISHLEAHRRSHFPTKEYQCVTCGEKLKYKSSLIRHEQDHHSGHICKICQSRFPSGKLLKRHSLEHKGAPCFPCILCGKIYTRSTRLRQHLKQAHQDWSFLREQKRSSCCNILYDKFARQSANIRDCAQAITLKCCAIYACPSPIDSLKCEHVCLFRTKHSDASNVRWLSSGNTLDKHVRCSEFKSRNDHGIWASIIVTPGQWDDYSNDNGVNMNNTQTFLCSLHPGDKRAEFR
ncbi:hypothetical protein CSKR_106476 [Clonorchis sinensis]|uniref:C2H2-type domain-containing protein n=1 Tax=Clonorchis sinensis TaxID=79923 RepID=A0A419PJB1_CLOSI|nr:hypothetical protein CSKR_106476 [Clonorchis sinensis]